MFENLDSQEYFALQVMEKEEIREMDLGNDLVSYCYMVSAPDTFDSMWTRECRGVVFARGGECVGRSLHKFFNVGERESTRVENLDWSKVVRVMDKRDGSMIHTVDIGGRTLLKSKKSFDSDVAKAASVFAYAKADYVRAFQRLRALNSTGIFEWTAPDARIVLAYAEPQLTLLHVRNNLNGEYWSSAQLRAFSAEFALPLVDEVTEFFLHDIIPGQQAKHLFNVNALLAAAETREGVEGWIVQFEDGEMVKVKTKWYLERHRAMTFLRERDIAEAVLHESVDDLKSLLVAEGVDISEIEVIEQRVVNLLNLQRVVVEDAVKFDKAMDRKSFAIKHRENPMFGLMIKHYLGEEPDYKGWFEKHTLKEQFSLRQLNLVQSVAEPD